MILWLPFCRHGILMHWTVFLLQAFRLQSRQPHPEFVGDCHSLELRSVLKLHFVFVSSFNSRLKCQLHDLETVNRHVPRRRSFSAVVDTLKSKIQVYFRFHWNLETSCMTKTRRGSPTWSTGLLGILAVSCEVSSKLDAGSTAQYFQTTSAPFFTRAIQLSHAIPRS